MTSNGLKSSIDQIPEIKTVLAWVRASWELKGVYGKNKGKINIE